MSKFEEYLETVKSADEVLKTLKTPRSNLSKTYKKR